MYIDSCLQTVVFIYRNNVYRQLHAIVFKFTIDLQLF